ncbi:MAG: NAD(+)/NADH kinase [Ruminococcaceae bacterium]|nr:NAD(+)/NADH kinase [Oscillospiraceae bacterium]
MKKIFIVTNPNKDVDYAITKKTVEILKKFGAEVSMPIAERESGIVSCDYVSAPSPDAELVIVIGGDGSFIDAAAYAEQNDIPIIGVNLGKVGYLNEIEPNELESLSKIFTGEYKIVTRMLLGVTVTENENDISFERYAVNDVVISNQEYMGISDFVVYSKDGGVRYRADGAVFSTPQGSTAYSLSAGGPIVSHDAGAIILTPIAPHSFFNRTIVFSENEVIKVKNTSNKALNVSLDGRLVYKLNSGDKISVKASDKKLKVMTFENNNMFSNLFSKMQILEDII